MLDYKRVLKFKRTGLKLIRRLIFISQVCGKAARRSVEEGYREKYMEAIESLYIQEIGYVIVLALSF
jgi:hypothetical protein